MAGSHRGRVGLVVAAAVTIALAVVALVLLRGDSEARLALDRFLTAWEGEDYAAAAALTDGEDETVERALEANRDGLDGATLEAEVEDFEEEGDQARARVATRWDVPVYGAFDYSTEVELEPGPAEGWQVRWQPDVVHPELAGKARLGTVKEFSPRAKILDRDGEPLVTPRPVVEVGVVLADLDDPAEAAEAVAEATGADAKQLRRSIRAAGPEQFVSAITLREDELAEVRAELERIDGVKFAERELPLAPTREFARALLGTVGPITEEQLDELGEPYGISDQVGQWGLQAAFERQLAGEPSIEIVIRNEAGVAVETLREKEGERGDPLRTTLDREVQSAAEAALGVKSGNAAIVVTEPSSGDLLAVANRPVEETFNRALEGQYPPGSTFKVITTAALLRDGLDPSETVECPRSISVAGKTFVNFEGSARGAVPFREDFSQSCNTAFVSLADRLGPEALPDTAADFGLARDYELPVPSFSGEVPEPEDTVEEAAQMIGQGRVIASPLAMAGVAATVAEGRWRAPRLVESDPKSEGPALDGAVVSELRRLMREVVTAGTGTALADVSGAPAGKSGTAEYGSGDPPPTHAWFIAYRDELAMSVLVEDAPSGGEVAAPIAAKLLETVGG